MTSCCDVITKYDTTKIPHGSEIGGVFIYKIMLILVFIRFLYIIICDHNPLHLFGLCKKDYG